MTVKIDKFGGIMPRTHPTLLADGMAVRAHNVKLKSGKIVPMRKPKEASADHHVLLRGSLSWIKDAQSLHVWRRYGGGFDFLAFKGVTWLANGNLADDEKVRVIISGDTEQKAESGDTGGDTPLVYTRDTANQDAIFIAKIWKKAFAEPVVTEPASGDTPSSGTIRYTVFFLTWVDSEGRESPPSPPSREIAYVSGTTQVTMTKPDLTSYPEAVKIRVYMAVAGTESEGAQYLTEFGNLSQLSNLQFTVNDEEVGEAMPEIEAPFKDLRCITEVPGSFYCGFSPSHPHTVAFSEVNLFYSWPVAYRYDVADNIVALAVTSNSVFALTDGWPYVLSGTAPDGMAVTKLAGPASCVSARSVCVYKNAVYYASRQGMMVIANSADAGTVCANLTEKFFTKDQWLALKPETCICEQFDGALHLFFDGGVDDSGEPVPGLRIDLSDDGATAVTTHDERAACACVDDEEDRLYFVRAAQ